MMCAQLNMFESILSIITQRRTAYYIEHSIILLLIKARKIPFTN